MRPTLSTVSTPAISIFFGSQPRSAQVPPNGRKSITATLQPAARTRIAATIAAVPVPTITRSYRLVMLFLRGLRSGTSASSPAMKLAGTVACLRCRGASRRARPAAHVHCARASAAWNGKLASLPDGYKLLIILDKKIRTAREITPKGDPSLLKSDSYLFDAVLLPGTLPLIKER